MRWSTLLALKKYFSRYYLFSEKASKESSMVDEHLVALEAAISRGGFLSGPDIGARYHTDTFGRSVAAPEGGLRPAKTEELSRVLKICHANGLAVIPQRGMTGLDSAALPSSGEIVVPLGTINPILVLD